MFLDCFFPCNSRFNRIARTPHVHVRQQSQHGAGDGALAGHVDTNCMFITSAAAFILPVWAMMDPSLTAIGDRVVLAVLQEKGVLAVETGAKTVTYESTWATHYAMAGVPVPPDAKATIGAVDLRAMSIRPRPAPSMA